MTIKKSFVPLVDLLEANKNKTIKSILPDIMKLVESRKHDTLKYNDDGKLTHVFCFYHKVWEDVSKVEYGKKAGTKSGLNTMCKRGVNQWTKQQRDAKKAKEQLLADVASGKVKPTDLLKKMDDIEAVRKTIVK